MSAPICTREIFESRGLPSPCRCPCCGVDLDEETRLEREYHDRMEKIGREYEKSFRVRLARLLWFLKRLCYGR